MAEFSDILKTRYETALQSDSDSLFYQNVHAYIDFIKTTPPLSAIIDRSEKEYDTKVIDKSDIAHYKDRLSSLERFSLYVAHYSELEIRIYWPIEYYKNPPIEVGDRLDPAALLMLKGFDRTVKMIADWEKKDLKILNKWYEGQRKHYERELTQFHADFLTAMAKEQIELLPKKTTTKIPLYLHPRTGDFSFHNTSGTIAPRTQEFKILSLLLSSEDYLANYSTLYQAISSSTVEIRKPHKEAISQIIRNLKEKLGILPGTKRSNPDIFKNFPKVGYRCKVPHS